jgi:hypothetical protein
MQHHSTLATVQEAHKDQRPAAEAINLIKNKI